MLELIVLVMEEHNAHAMVIVAAMDIILALVVIAKDFRPVVVLLLALHVPAIQMLMDVVTIVHVMELTGLAIAEADMGALLIQDVHVLEETVPAILSLIVILNALDIQHVHATMNAIVMEMYVLVSMYVTMIVTIMVDSDNLI